MAAPLENTNAEHWTIELANEFCEKVLSVLEENDSMRTLGGACLKAGGYETIINYLQDKFKVEFEPIKKAKEIVKERLIEQGLENKVNPTMAIFILKNNHNFTDKQQTDLTTNGKELNSNIQIEIVQPDED